MIDYLIEYLKIQYNRLIQILDVVRSLSPSTYAQYKRALQRFDQFLSKYYGLIWEDANKNNVKAYITFLNKK